MAANAVEYVMSFFSTLKADIEKMWKKAPAIEVAMASAVDDLVPVVEELDLIIDPALAPELNSILDKIKTGLSALKTTVQGAGSSPSVTSIVASVNANLGALVATAQIKNPELVAKIQEVAAIVTPAINEVAAG